VAARRLPNIDPDTSTMAELADLAQSLITKFVALGARHAATLALVGWILIVPPSTLPSDSEPLGGFDANAPISKWEIDTTYDSLAACQAFQRKQLAIGADWLKNPNPLVNGAAKAWQHSVCISSDDPRLKSK
jgi:hypothetical protein